MELKSGFIKTSVPALDSQRKVAFNRKGNELFNSGDIETAKKIFLATGYSDGLTRIGDYYIEHNRMIEGIQLYVQAHNTRKIGLYAEKLASIMHSILHNGE